jgi:hypothetical protein
VEKVSDLNYKIVDMTGKEQTVHVSRLKIPYDQRPWKQETTTRVKHKRNQTIAEDQNGQEIEVQSRPIVTEDKKGAQRVEQELQSLIPAAGADTPSVDRETQDIYPDSTLRDPNYTPSRSPQSRRELAATPQAPPVTRSRARLQQLRDMNNPPEG